MSIHEADVRRIFEQVNAVTAGHPSDVVMAALQDLIVAALCYVCPTKAEAKLLCADIHVDLQNTIDKNYDYYHSQKNAAAAAKRRSN
jgi:hypothetical protein